MGRWRRWALALSCVAGLGQSFYVYSTSPEVVPVHYGPTGLPDRWGSPAELLIVHGAVIGIGTAVFFALPALVRRGPRSWVNLPNKEYWLAPERREEAAAKLASWSSVFGTALNLLVITLQSVLAPSGTAARSTPGALPLLVTLTFVLFTAGSCVWLARSYRLPASID